MLYQRMPHLVKFKANFIMEGTGNMTCIFRASVSSILPPLKEECWRLGERMVCMQAGRQAGRQAHRRNGVMYVGTSIQTHIYMYMMHTALTCMHTDTTSRYPPEHLELVKAMSSIAMSPYGPLPRTPSNTTCR